MKRLIRATTNPAFSERERKNAALARKIGAEGIVLFENNGALPIKDKKIALFGFGARHTCYGGTGSGENRPRYKVNIEEGLKNAGYEITTVKWLDDFDNGYNAAYDIWHKELIAGLKKCKKLLQMDYASAHPFIPPFGRDITATDKIQSDTETAIYVLTRQAGEGTDRKTVKGDYYIQKEELKQLKQICELYQKTVLLLNVSGVIDLSFTKQLNISAIVNVMQGGMEAGNSIADVLSGKVTPCGRLAVTWAENYEDYPSYNTFSYRSGNSREENYREGIYVGYRWFCENNVKARYPFGYGMSYTQFSTKYEKTTVNNGKVTCSFSVKNIGNYEGKEVVQIYLSAPVGKLHKEKVSLCGFSKTKCLQPAERQNVEVKFDLRNCASYDEETASFILEKGEYIVYLGENAEELTAICILNVDSGIVTEKCKNVCPVKQELQLYQPSDDAREIPNVERITVAADSIGCVLHTYDKPLPLKDKKVEKIVEKLSVYDKINLLVGTSYVGGVRNTVFGAGGYSTSAYLKQGIPNMPMADGPQGLNVTPRSIKPKQNFMNIPALPEMLQYGLAGWFAARSVPKENDNRKVYYQYGTAFPSAMVVAQTWDLELIKEQGRAIGTEMEEFGVVFWLAPAINIHRNPLCGRNYEYYSEDPYLSGKLAAAVTGGVQEHKGCYVTLKHFACNNLETDRNRSSSNLDERTLREIYLKAFKIAICESGSKGIMASYNKVNGVYMPNNYDLLTDVLRNEFGFDGLVMTDWFAAGHDESLTELCCKSGCDMVMPGLPADVKKIKKAYKSGVVSKQEIEISAQRIIKAALDSNATT